jgi:hypothetical protein
VAVPFGTATVLYLSFGILGIHLKPEYCTFFDHEFVKINKIWNRQKLMPLESHLPTWYLKIKKK